MSTDNPRDNLSTEERCLPLEHTIDPGFVNRRLVETILGDPGMEFVNRFISRIPASLPQGLMDVRIDHAYNNTLIQFVKIHEFPTLSSLLSAGEGRIFCSTEQLAPTPSVYSESRVTTEILPRGNTDFKIFLEYTTSHCRGDTLLSTLSQGGLVSVVAILDRVDGDSHYYRPLVMGGPWLHTSDPAWKDKVIWWSVDFFENFIEDFDEFSKVREHPSPDSCDDLRNVPEKKIKECIAKLLGDIVTKDWGGETSDHFTAHIHLNGERTTAAFLLKGPSKFSPMGLNHLGKNNDQIYRLAQEPAQVLFVQHCHDILPAVRETLRVFAVQPGRPRRYCLIDGRDTLRLLSAYGFLDAKQETGKVPV